MADKTTPEKDQPELERDAPRTAWAKATMGGPATPPESPRGPSDASPAQRLARKLEDGAALAAGTPYNRIKPTEHGRDAARTPARGEPVPPASPDATGSTLSEQVDSDKVGALIADGENANCGPLDRVRADGGGQQLTSNQGVAVGQNQDSLKAGLRGPTLMEDFLFREKITHFDHERIPERVVHARGSGAHGYFECTTAMTQYTRAAPFAAVGKRTPVFVRFSTVVGERGSVDTARDVRGFAVKFYTDEGNWDLVGNNIPVFFIQDALKFPDLIHAAKPEPHHAMPQAATAHDTFWDFVSLMPESTHMLMWAMSDRAIPRSYRTMQGFGVHTFRLVAEDGSSVLCKFHWNPVAGTHSLVWDEAVKIGGADPDFHRRDLWESIESGVYPEWELGVQIFTEEQAEQFSFDVLDATKIVPEELVPVTPIGRMVLNRNPDNFFAETEQVAFCTANVVPGIDFTNDPLLQGRNHSYVDTQLSRLGGPNFQEIPINAPVVPVFNNQRDGFHRQTINRGRVSYEPNSLAGGCPFQAGMRGFTSFPRMEQGEALRGKPEKFADHYTQARLFWESQTPAEQEHIVDAFRFELTRVQTPAVRERMVAGLANVDATLARRVGNALGIVDIRPLPKALPNPAPPEIERSEALSLMARPGASGARGRRVAILVAGGASGTRAVYDAVAEAGAVPRHLAAMLGTLAGSAGTTIEVDITIAAAPACLFDAVVLPDGAAAVDRLAANGQVVEFLRDQYRHCKPILALGASAALLDAAGIPETLPSGARDAAQLRAAAGDADALQRFITLLGSHRDFAREGTPPPV